MHLVAAGVAVLGIWCFSKFFHYLWGIEDPRLFDAMPLRYMFDAADVAVIARFIWRTLTEIVEDEE